MTPPCAAAGGEAPQGAPAGRPGAAPVGPGVGAEIGAGAGSVLDPVDRAIEAVVLVATEPVDPGILAQLLERPVAEIDARCAALAARYAAAGHGFALARVAGGWRFETHPDCAAYVERFVLDAQPARLSPAALETLAIIAYKQPVSRAQLGAIRGVNVDATLGTLIERGYVAEVGHDPGPGRAALFGTTRRFLEQLGLDSLDELPPLAQFVPDPSVVERLERHLRAGDDPRTAR